MKNYYECVLCLKDYPYVILSVNKFRSINRVCHWLDEVNLEYCFVQCFRKDGSSVNVDELMEVYNA